MGFIKIPLGFIKISMEFLSFGNNKSVLSTLSNELFTVFHGYCGGIGLKTGWVTSRKSLFNVFSDLLFYNVTAFGSQC